MRLLPARTYIGPGEAGIIASAGRMSVKVIPEATVMCFPDTIRMLFLIFLPVRVS